MRTENSNVFDLLVVDIFKTRFRFRDFQYPKITKKFDLPQSALSVSQLSVRNIEGDSVQAATKDGEPVTGRSGR